MRWHSKREVGSPTIICNSKVSLRDDVHSYEDVKVVSQDCSGYTYTAKSYLNKM